jgi:hypothetical protein
MLVSDLLSYVRRGLGSSASSRWEDADILSAAQVATVRAQGILQRNNIAFGRTSVEFSTVAAQQAYDVPGDLAAVYGLWKRTSTPQQLRHVTIDEWESIITAREATVFAIDGESLKIAGTPQSAFSMVLHYWPIAPTLSLSGSTPWNGRLDYVIGDYCRARLYNNDEMEVSQDIQLLQDLENNIVSQFSEMAPKMVTRRGWLV